MTRHSLDCTDPSCPIPIVEMAPKVCTLNSGEPLDVSAKDRVFKSGIKTWSRRAGHEVDRLARKGLWIATQEMDGELLSCFARLVTGQAVAIVNLKAVSI